MTTLSDTRIPIAPDNDLTIEIGPIRGRHPTTGLLQLYTGATLTGWITASRTSNTALGSITNTFAAIGTTAKFVAYFDAPDVTTILTAAGALTDGQSLWCIVKGVGDFRKAIELVYRAARTD